MLRYLRGNWIRLQSWLTSSYRQKFHSFISSPLKDGKSNSDLGSHNVCINSLYRPGIWTQDPPITRQGLYHYATDAFPKRRDFFNKFILTTLRQKAKYPFCEGFSYQSLWSIMAPLLFFWSPKSSNIQPGEHLDGWPIGKLEISLTNII